MQPAADYAGQMAIFERERAAMDILDNGSPHLVHFHGTAVSRLRRTVHPVDQPVALILEYCEGGSVESMFEYAPSKA